MILPGVTINDSEGTRIADIKSGKYFRWSYIVLPVVIFLLSAILVAAFYGRLPAEVCYRISDTASPAIGRAAIIAWLLVPQFILALLGAAVGGIGAVISRKYGLADSNHIKSLLTAMGNMVALPQIILIFAMLDIFLYNAYEIRTIPLWIVIITVLLLGTIMLGIFFFKSIGQLRRSNVNQNQE